MIQPWLVWQLARKDLLLFLADRRGLLLCFGVPIVLASVFGAVFHRPDADAGPRPKALIVADGDAPLLGRIRGALTHDARLDAATCDLATARRRLASEGDAVVVVLPAALGELSLASVSAADRPRVELLHHPRHHWEARWVEGVLTEVVLREAARELLAPVTRLNPGLKVERPFTVAARAEPAGGALSSHAFSHAFCGMTLQYLLFWGMDSGLLLLRERRQGLWRRLRAAPVSRLTLLAGRAVATALVALLLIATTFGFGAAVFGVRIGGSFAGFALMAIACALLSAATGLLVAALGGNENRARSVAILAILTLSLLGGLWLPSFLLPGWAQRVALLLPTTWAARGLEGVTWQGMTLAGAWPCALALGGFSAAFLVVAWWRLVRADGPCVQGGGACAA